MLALRKNLKVYVWLKPIDMRKSINGLTALVFDEFEASPQSGHLFLFYNKKKDKVKLIYWDRNGFVLHYKRLDKGCFKFARRYSQDSLSINENQLNWHKKASNLSSWSDLSSWSMRAGRLFI